MLSAVGEHSVISISSGYQAIVLWNFLRRNED